VIDAVRAKLAAVDGVLFWVNPIHNGRNRTHLDALLREVAARGVWVSAHPDVILKMATKEMPFATRTMGWGSDTALYRTAETIALETRASLVPKRNRFLGLSGRAARASFPGMRRQQTVNTTRVSGGVSVIIAIEVHPGPLCAALLDPVRPDPEFFVGIVVPVPSLRTVKAHVDLVSGPDKFIRQTGPATGAEDNPGLLEGGINLAIPPALMPELHNVAARGIELTHDRSKAGFGVAKARWQLKEEATHLLAENIGDDAKILHKRFRAFELLNMRDELADLHRVNELHVARLTFPGLDARYSGPGVKGRVDLNGVKGA
jgi:hypothetical protein